MTNETPPDEQNICPAWLRAGEGFEDWRVAAGLEVMEIAAEFGRQHRVDLEVAVMGVYVAAAHALGGSIQFDLPHERVAAPFSVLILTPEASPIWGGIPLRFLREGLAEFFSHHIQLQRSHAPERPAADRHGSQESPDPEPGLRVAERLLRDQLIDKTIVTVYREDLKAPFGRPPIDGHVTIGPPRRGLLRALQELDRAEKLLLEDALNGSIHGGAGNQTMACGQAAFFWTLPERQAGSLFRRNPWFADIPFVLLRTSQPEFLSLDNWSGVCGAFEQIGRRLFGERLRHSVGPRIVRLPAGCAKPVMRLLDQAQQQEPAARLEALVSARQVMNLGLRLALVLMRLRDTTEPTPELIESTLELAKHFGRSHRRNLSAHSGNLAAGNAETTELTNRERQAYLRIVELKRVRRADLRKGFHQMSAAERDKIVVRLLALGLIRQEGEHLMQHGA